MKPARFRHTVEVLSSAVRIDQYGGASEIFSLVATVFAEVIGIPVDTISAGRTKMQRRFQIFVRHGHPITPGHRLRFEGIDLDVSEMIDIDGRKTTTMITAAEVE